MENTLYYGDNLDILERNIPDESVDLIYLDPPFKSNQNYNILFKEKNGTGSAAQISAFEDTWHWDQNAEETYVEITENAPKKVADLIIALRDFLGSNDMMVYLTMMASRLVELHRVLKDSGSIYLHCDPTASHYLKIVLDTIFGPKQFRNEIIWRRKGSHNSAKRYGPIHDVILFYTRSDSYFFKTNHRPYLKGHVDGYFKKQDEKGKYWTNALTGQGIRYGASGKPWRNYDPSLANRHWAIPGKIILELGIDANLTIQEKLDSLDEVGFIDHPSEKSKSLPTYHQYLDGSPGMPLQDIWAYQPHTKNILYNSGECIDEDARWLVAQGDTERLGYPTQKPVGLIERIIKSSCPEKGCILDPFCGCGTTIIAAEKQKRKWIGIDITHLAISLMRHRLKDTFGDEVKFKVVGEPVDLKGAEILAKQDPYQFQWWSLGLVGARPAESEKKKGGDKGIDGYIYFHDEPQKTKKIVIQVKSGHVNPGYIRDLRGVIEREKAQIGVFITLQEPTAGMKKEAVSAGYYKLTGGWGQNYLKIQILTIKDLLEGKKIEYPPEASITFKKAKKHVKDDFKQYVIKEE